jgi:predicted nucleic acid-binding Zn ribbon protein
MLSSRQASRRSRAVVQARKGESMNSVFYIIGVVVVVLVVLSYFGLR